jgi:tRNA dimethylallyltransferase
MLEQGFQKEVESLYSREGMHKNLPSMKAVGYRQMWSYLDNKSSYEDMVKQGITATRRLAKHQFTWLRGMQNLNWFDCENKKYINKVLKFLESATISH